MTSNPSRPSGAEGPGRRVVAGGLGALLAAPALVGRAAAQDSEWRLGALFPLTGNLSVLGTEALAGAEVAVDIANERGGVLGRRVTLVKADVTSPANATNEARRLITREGLRFLTGTYGSSIALAIAAAANQFRAVYWENSAVADEVTTRGHRFVFRLNDNASIMAAGLLQCVEDIFAPSLGRPLNALKIAVAHEDSAFGSSVAGNFVAHLRAKGGTPAMVEPYAANTQDLSSLVLRLKELRPDVLVVTQYFNDAILFWRQARNADWTPRYFVSTGAGQATPDYQRGVGRDAEGVLIADVPAAGVRQDALAPEAAAALRDFVARYQAKLGKAPASHSIRQFSSMQVLLTKVLPAAGSLDPERIRSAVMALDEPVGSTVLGFGIKYNEGGQNERAFNVILQWQNGQLATVWPERFATARPVMVPLPEWRERPAG